MKCRIACITNKGLKREKNEDAILINNIITQDDNMTIPVIKDLEEDLILLAVADGLGGHSGGERASRLTLETLIQYFPLNESEIIRTLRQAHYNLVNYVASNPQYYGLGSCIAGTLITTTNSIVFNVGDCRVYKFYNNKLSRITKDHSLVQEFIDKGLLTSEEARFHPYRNIVTESIGGRMDYRLVDVRTYIEKIEQNTIFLICSDGLFDMLTDKEIEKNISSELEKSILQLFNQTMERGASDNISIILCQYL